MSVICLLEGTVIATPDGNCFVENLAVGDEVRLPNGKSLKVIFIGKQVFDLATAPEAHPITFEAHSISAEMPNAPLHLSAKHGVWNGQNWYQAEQLLNGHSIKLMDSPPPTIHYYNIELEVWATVLANNLPCESYRDLGNRNEFHYSTQVVGQSLVS